MRTRQLGKSELWSSVIGLGALHFGVYLDEGDAIGMVHHALASGVNFIDTGPLYGNGMAETIVGKAIKGRRGKCLLSTKVGLARNTRPDGTFGVEVVPLRPERIRAALEKSLRELQTDYIDLFQFHAFDDSTALEESFETMDRLVQEGKILAVGASNYDANELLRVISTIRANNWLPLAALECHYNAIERRAESQILPICREWQISIIPYRSLARGILTGKYTPEGTIPEHSRAVDSWRVRRLLDDATLRLVGALSSYARENGHSVTELAIAWHLSRQETGSVLIGARNQAQFDECAKATSWQLNASQLQEIDTIIENEGRSQFVAKSPDVFFEK